MSVPRSIVANGTGKHDPITDRICIGNAAEKSTKVSQSIDNPILNSPYEPPDRYYELGPKGPTGQVRDGRRPSESFIPIAIAKKGTEADQAEFDFDATGERRERNSLINDLRRDIARWRRDCEYPGVTPISRKLLQHWGDPERENRVLFCQREAAEAAIFLTKVAGRKGECDRLASATRAAQRRAQCRPAQSCVEDGDRRGQDRGDGNADRLADTE